MKSRITTTTTRLCVYLLAIFYSSVTVGTQDLLAPPTHLKSRVLEVSQDHQPIKHPKKTPSYFKDMDGEALAICATLAGFGAYCLYAFYHAFQSPSTPFDDHVRLSYTNHTIPESVQAMNPLGNPLYPIERAVSYYLYNTSLDTLGLAAGYFMMETPYHTKGSQLLLNVQANLMHWMTSVQNNLVLAYRVTHFCVHVCLNMNQTLNKIVTQAVNDHQTTQPIECASTHLQAIFYNSYFRDRRRTQSPVLFVDHPHQSLKRNLLQNVQAPPPSSPAPPSVIIPLSVFDQFSKVLWANADWKQYARHVMQAHLMNACPTKTSYAAFETLTRELMASVPDLFSMPISILLHRKNDHLTHLETKKRISVLQKSANRSIQEGLANCYNPLSIVELLGANARLDVDFSKDDTIFDFTTYLPNATQTPQIFKEEKETNTPSVTEKETGSISLPDHTVSVSKEERTYIINGSWVLDEINTKCCGKRPGVFYLNCNGIFSCMWDSQFLYYLSRIMQSHRLILDNLIHCGIVAPYYNNTPCYNLKNLTFTFKKTAECMAESAGTEYWLIIKQSPHLMTCIGRGKCSNQPTQWLYNLYGN